MERGGRSVGYARISDGNSRFPVVGLDSEGNGIRQQMLWVGQWVPECLVVGPNYFPVLWGLYLVRKLII